MPIQRFGLNSNLAPEKLVLFENYGLTVYMAQLYERGLQNVLTGLETLGALTIPSDMDRSRDGFIDECLSPMLRILESQSKMDRKVSRLLQKAQYQRNELIHRFLVDNGIEMLHAAGRASVNDTLRRMYDNICRAHWIVYQLAEKIFTELGITPESVTKNVAELRRLSENRGDETHGTDHV